MIDKGSILISVIVATLFLVFLVVNIGLFLPRYTSLRLPTQNESEDTGSVNITDPINQAQSVAIQANLKSIQVGLEIYYSEFGSYPNSLQELSSGGYLNQGVNISNYNYLLCDNIGSKALLYNNSSPYPGVILGFNGQQSVQGDSPPICT